jgi:hypothetical protein
MMSNAYVSSVGMEMGLCLIAFDSCFCVYVFNFLGWFLSLLGSQASGLDYCCGVEIMELLFRME